MAVQPLSPATHRRLGGPLPRQLANGPQAHPPALPQELSQSGMCRTVSCGIITCFHVLFPTGGQITHVLLTRPPLPPTRGWTFVRLACLRRAASVRSEPGSNSPSWSPAPKCRQLFIRFCLSSKRTRLLFILLPLFSSRIDSKLNYYKLLSSLPFADISQKTSHLVSFCFRYFNRVPKYSTKYDLNMSTLNFKIF